MAETKPAAVPVRVADRIAGFVVQDPTATRFRFVAVDRRFGVLDGSRFWHLRDAQRAADRLAWTTRDESVGVGRAWEGAGPQGSA